MRAKTPYRERINAFERETILAALTKARSIRQAAFDLGMDRKQLYQRMAALGIESRRTVYVVTEKGRKALAEAPHA